MSDRLERFILRNVVLLTTQFPYRKGLGAYDVLLCVSQTLESSLKSGQEARIVQIDYSVAVFHRVNHQGILYNHCFVGILVLCCPN